MCDHDKTRADAATAGGSRRRRLWELPTNCHCPIIGVCLPLALLRKLVNKLAATPVHGDDYDVHVRAVHESAARSSMSELLQRTLDERFAAVVRQFRAARDEAGVSALWRQAMERGDVAGAFWAALTHPRSDLLLIETFVRDMHMIQHQAGAGARVDLHRFADLQQQTGLLAAELEQVRDKAARTLETKTKELAQQSDQMLHLRAELAQRDARIDSLQRALDTLAADLPDLGERRRLQARVAELETREAALAAKLAQLRRRTAHAQPAPASAAPAAAPAPAPAHIPVRPLLNLADKTVLCVGGRSGNVPHYRAVLEQEGARFVHHDGGLEQASELLDTGLAAADLVICQTGCISHQAYWRVKDFCKRTGKRCLYVENPSTSSLALCLQNAGERDTSAA
jgi:hypothetical protein